MTVLILTSEEDVTADMVVLRLTEAGVPVVRLDPADLTNGVALSGAACRPVGDVHLVVGDVAGRIGLGGSGGRGVLP
ncbi:hypothetical protein AB0H32_48060, partial [Streptomyces sp. NPDC020362]